MMNFQESRLLRIGCFKWILGDKNSSIGSSARIQSRRPRGSAQKTIFVKKCILMLLLLVIIVFWYKIIMGGDQEKETNGGRPMEEDQLLEEDHEEFDIDFIGLQLVRSAESVHNKGWSSLNKFKVQLEGSDELFMMKISGIANELNYRFVAKTLGADDMVLPTPTVVLGCDVTDEGQSVVESFWNALENDAWASTHKDEWEKKKKSDFLSGLMVPFMSNIETNWKISKRCFDMEDPRAFAVVVMDYIVGYVDRPANCHLVNDMVYAVDNDSGHRSIWFKEKHADFQKNWLFEKTQADADVVCEWMHRHSDFLNVADHVFSMEKAYKFAMRIWTEVDQRCGDHSHHSDDFERKLAGIHEQLVESMYMAVRRYEKLQDWILTHCA